ncbi:LPD25 domain-containing protein [Aliivibrio fischeri]|uniref:LPD25 domain-containing protein n=1 Tax=Aliivibrio fischeri TaxID=668 RepID=UPI001C031916|nr:hypothetical protein [Aliivibrio fischeri]
MKTHLTIGKTAMTHSTAINSTITKETEATNVSPFEQSGSNKNECIQSESVLLAMFDRASGNRVSIRKNAVKKIGLLLSLATKVVKINETYSSDSCTYNEIETVSTIADVHEYMKEEYQNLKIELTRNSKNGDIKLVMNKGVWSFISMVITFGKVEPEVIDTITLEDAQEDVRPRMTYNAVKAYLDSGFISPLNHGLVATDEKQEDEDKKIVKVVVLWSESRAFNKELREQDKNGNINQEISLDEYNRLTWLTLADQKRYLAEHEDCRGYGYDKTKVEITLASGEVCQFRHDICFREPTLEGEWSLWVDYCRAEEERKSAKLH